MLKEEQLTNQKNRKIKLKKDLENDIKDIWYQIMALKYDANQNEADVLSKKFKFKENDIIGIIHTDAFTDDQMSCTEELYNQLLETPAGPHCTHDPDNEILFISTEKRDDDETIPF